MSREGSRKDPTGRSAESLKRAGKPGGKLRPWTVGRLLANEQSGTR